MKPSILIVEKELIFALEIESFVISKGFNNCCIVSTSKDLLNIILDFKPDVILVDLNIDKSYTNIIELISKIQKKIITQIIYLTSSNNENILDDVIKTNPISYLQKPFNKIELFAALKIAKNNLQKNFSNPNDTVLLDFEYTYKLKDRQLIFNNEYISLTKKEREFLYMLIHNKNSIVTIYQMENELWPDKTANENTRRSLVLRVRKKLNYKFIETISGIGYRINI